VGVLVGVECRKVLRSIAGRMAWRVFQDIPGIGVGGVAGLNMSLWFILTRFASSSAFDVPIWIQLALFIFQRR
jgi:hypothetical protein